jgi:hypothetical protein
MALVVQEGPIHTRYNCTGEQSWKAPTVAASDRMVAAAMVAELERYLDQSL